MLPTSAGVEPATSWSPVGRRIQLSHRGGEGDCICSLVVGNTVVLAVSWKRWCWIVAVGSGCTVCIIGGNVSFCIVGRRSLGPSLEIFDGSPELGNVLLVNVFALRALFFGGGELSQVTVKVVTVFPCWTDQTGKPVTRVLQKVLSLGSLYFSATFYQTYKPSKYSPFTETHFFNLFTQSRKADK